MKILKRKYHGIDPANYTLSTNEQIIYVLSDFIGNNKVNWLTIRFCLVFFMINQKSWAVFWVIIRAFMIIIWFMPLLGMQFIVIWWLGFCFYYYLLAKQRWFVCVKCGISFLNNLVASNRKKKCKSSTLHRTFRQGLCLHIYYADRYISCTRWKRSAWII